MGIKPTLSTYLGCHLFITAYPPYPPSTPARNFENSSFSLEMATSGGQAIGRALTSGIQDIAALLPLLGTDQCEDHVASALTKGYLYSSATPLSIFGSLGAARAGFKAFLSATSIRRFVGAKILANAGFQPQGENLSLIMLDEDRKGYCAEKRLAAMMTDLHLEDSNRISISSKCWKWNFDMIVVTAFSCIVSITPYIHLNLHANTLTHFVRWAFPVIRAIGGFLTATMIQAVIQTRVLSIMRKRLILDSLGEGELEHFGIDPVEQSSWVRFPTLDQRCSLLERHVRQKLKDIIDPEEGRWRNTGASSDRNESTDTARLEDFRMRIIEANGSAVLRGTFLLLLFIGIIASAVGYVGCFTVVQGSSSSTEAIIWLCLEGGLSIIRIILWGINPESDDAPPLKLTIKLDEHAPLPTCTRPAEEIEETKILPLVRAPEFLKAITPYAGLLTQFSYPMITLYYTLTRRNNTTPGSSKRVLYITIFDHTERTTRIYSEDWNTTNSQLTCFYSADELTVDLEHGILTTKIGQRIQHQYDPIARNANSKLRITLAEHYSSILRQVNSGIGNHHLEYDMVENDWTLKLGDKKSEMQKFGEQQSEMQTFGDADTLGKFGDRGDRRDEEAVEHGENELIDIKHDQSYLEQRRVEQKVRHLIRDRGQQIEDYMTWLHATIDKESRMMKVCHIEADEMRPVKEVEEMLMDERREMELMLVDEVHEWEEKLRVCRHGFLHGIDAEMSAKLERRWRTDLWERMKDGELAMKARMNAAGIIFSQRATDAEMSEYLVKAIRKAHTEPVERAWRLLLTELYESAGTPSPAHRPSSRLKTRLDTPGPRYFLGNEKATRRWQKRMASRLEREADDVEERLERGLDHCHEFRSNAELVNLTHSESKWLRIRSFNDNVIKALKRNKHIIHLSIDVKADISDADITRFFDNFNSTSCTSVHFWNDVRIPDSVKLPPNILSITGPHVSQFNAAVEQHRSQLVNSRKTTVEIAHMTMCTFIKESFTERYLAPLKDASHPGFTLRFFGPDSSDHLTLQLIHRSRVANVCLTVELEGSLKFTYPITPFDEFGLQNITITNNRRHSSGLTFEPGCRNTLTFIVPSKVDRFNGYHLLDVELLDKDGNHYNGEVTLDQEENDADR